MCFRLQKATTPADTAGLPSTPTVTPARGPSVVSLTDNHQLKGVPDWIQTIDMSEDPI